MSKKIHNVELIIFDLSKLKFFLWVSIIGITLNGYILIDGFYKSEDLRMWFAIICVLALSINIYFYIKNIVLKNVHMNSKILIDYMQTNIINKEGENKNESNSSNR